MSPVLQGKKTPQTKLCCPRGVSRVPSVPSPDCSSSSSATLLPRTAFAGLGAMGTPLSDHMRYFKIYSLFRQVDHSNAEFHVSIHWIFKESSPSTNRRPARKGLLPLGCTRWKLFPEMWWEQAHLKPWMCEPDFYVPLLLQDIITFQLWGTPLSFLFNRGTSQTQ